MITFSFFVFLLFSAITFTQHARGKNWHFVAFLTIIACVGITQ